MSGIGSPRLRTIDRIHLARLEPVGCAKFKPEALAVVNAPKGHQFQTLGGGTVLLARHPGLDARFRGHEPSV